MDGLHSNIAQLIQGLGQQQPPPDPNLSRQSQGLPPDMTHDVQAIANSIVKSHPGIPPEQLYDAVNAKIAMMKGLAPEYRAQMQAATAGNAETGRNNRAEAKNYLTMAVADMSSADKAAAREAAMARVRELDDTREAVQEKRDATATKVQGMRGKTAEKVAGMRGNTAVTVGKGHDEARRYGTDHPRPSAAPRDTRDERIAKVSIAYGRNHRNASGAEARAYAESVVGKAGTEQRTPSAQQIGEVKKAIANGDKKAGPSFIAYFGDKAASNAGIK